MKDSSFSRRDFLAVAIAGGLSTCFKLNTHSNLFAVTVEGISPETIVDFPSLTADGGDNIWLSTLERTENSRSVNLYTLNGNISKLAACFSPQQATALGASTIAALDTGCVIAMPIERDGKWQIVYSFVEANSKPTLNYIDCRGTSNISPSIAVIKNKAHIVWESNAGNNRSVYYCLADKSGHGKPRQISAQNENSYNPAIVALENGNVFAAWDSLRNKSADIWGRMMQNGKWQLEKRITSDVRIERHPKLCAKGNDVWMCWQAHSYEKIYTDYKMNFRSLRLNAHTEQLIAVAKITDKGLFSPKDLFTTVSGKLLTRPQIAFGPDGSLYLSVRESIAPQAGWLPVLWRYDSNGWSCKQTLCDQQGRWRGAAITATKDGITAAFEKDNLTKDWVELGDYPAWNKQIETKNISMACESEKLVLKELEMPKVDFSLEEKIDLCAAELPRQKHRIGDEELTLFWGDFHNHTDISVCQRSTNPPAHDLLANEKDIQKMDFCAITDHGYNFDKYIWEYHREQVRFNHDPRKFVTFLAQEWTSNANPPLKEGQPRRYGHHNIVYLGDNHKKYYDAFDGDISPSDIWNELKGEEYLFIPHQIADNSGFNPPTDWSFVDEKLQPVAEIFQARGSYEYLGCPLQSPTAQPAEGYYIQDVWAKGNIIGVVASPDHGGGYGKTGVWAKELSREAIFDAVRKRHTFGTSGPKMALQFSSGENIMGDKTFHPRSPIDFNVKAMGMRNISELVIFRNNEIVYKTCPDCKEFNINWRDDNPPKEKTLWYYIRIQADRSELAWSSPIWFTV
jgi:uncharacterized protein DUF3604